MATTKAAETEVKAKEERVTIELFKDSGRYKDDLVVVYNGKAYQIQRGKKVEVPVAVAEIIENSMEQDRRATDYMEALEEDYNNMVRRIG